MPDIFIGDNSAPIKEDAPAEETPEKVPQADGAKKTQEASKIPPKHNHTHFFAAYCEKPPTVDFKEKLENEELLLLLRKHFVTNIPWILKAIFLALVPPVLGILNSGGLINLDFLPGNYFTMLVVFYYLIIFGYIFTSYLTWFYNISLVTTQRIIDIDFSSIVFENVAATKLSQVEDVSYSQIGVIRSVFDYGNVLVQTAAHVDEFEFKAVPHPEKVITIINDLIGDHENA